MPTSTPTPTSTQTVMDNMALFGATIGADETDNRPAPDRDYMGRGALEIMDIMANMVAGSCFEDETAKLLFSFVYVWHRRVFDLNREVDRAELDLQGLIREQDGSEVKDLQLIQATDKAHHLQDKVATYEQVCDTAARAYESMTGNAWVPPNGSKNGFGGSAAILDGSDFMKARKERRAATVKDPDAPVVVFSGGRAYNDHNRIFKILDAQHKAYPDMVLVTSAQLSGADKIAIAWARNRKVMTVKCLPEKKYGNRAAFVRNETMLGMGHVIGVIVADGSGIQKALLREAKSRGLKTRELTTDTPTTDTQTGEGA